ncbi:MAG: hypothetical protein N2999_01440, partial [Proteobacteria bacterium]|nr:hypothetical protein [Pseudomonadota bacterium]
MDEKQKKKLMRKIKIMNSINSTPVIKTLFVIFNDILNAILNTRKSSLTLEFTILRYRYYLPESVNRKALYKALIEHGLLPQNANEIVDKHINNTIKPEIKEKGILNLLIFSPVH